MTDRAKFQFGLRGLLWAVTAVAVLLSAAVTFPELSMLIAAVVVGGSVLLCLVVVGVDVYLWVKNPAPDSGTRGGKLGALFRSKHFWTAFCSMLFIAVLLNVIPYYFSYGAYKTNGCEVAGWPKTFFARCGKIVYSETFDAEAFVNDVLVGLALAAATGIVFRDGASSLVATTRMLRTWPLNEPARPPSSDDESAADQP